MGDIICSFKLSSTRLGKYQLSGDAQLKDSQSGGVVIPIGPTGGSLGVNCARITQTSGSKTSQIWIMADRSCTLQEWASYDGGNTWESYNVASLTNISNDIYYANTTSYVQKTNEQVACPILNLGNYIPPNNNAYDIVWNEKIKGFDKSEQNEFVDYVRTPPQYTWQSVPSISGKNGILSLSTLNDINDGEEVITDDTSKFNLTNESNTLTLVRNNLPN